MFLVEAFPAAAALLWPLVEFSRSVSEQRHFGPLVIGEITNVIGTSGGIREPQSHRVEVTLPDGTKHRVILRNFRAIGCGEGLKIEVREFRGKYVLGPNACNISANVVR